MTLIMGILLTVAVSCSDPYSEITDEEVIELPMTDDDDDEGAKRPGSSNQSSQTGG